MGILDFLANISTPAGFAAFLHLLVVVLEFLYVIFAFILLRQVKLMNKSLVTPLARSFDVVALVHLILAVLLVVFSLA